MRKRFILSTALLACAATSGGLAYARTPSASVPSEPKYSPWQSKKDTLFVSTVTDMGVIYVRPRVMLGYGAPHWKYVALDAHWIVTNSFTAPYVGWRASLPFLDAMLGVRTVFPWDRRILPQRDSHDADDLDIGYTGKRSTYQAGDFELAAFAPVLHGILYLQAHPVIVNAPRSVHIYEEVLRVVMRPPYALGTRAGYFYGVGESQAFKTGLVAEYVVMPGRPRNVTRLGPAAFMQFDANWEALFAFSVVADSPDTLGIWHGTYAYLGLTHRWAKRL